MKKYFADFLTEVSYYYLFGENTRLAQEQLVRTPCVDREFATFLQYGIDACRFEGTMRHLPLPVRPGIALQVDL